MATAAFSSGYWGPCTPSILIELRFPPHHSSLQDPLATRIILYHLYYFIGIYPAGRFTKSKHLYVNSLLMVKVMWIHPLERIQLNDEQNLIEKMSY